MAKRFRFAVTHGVAIKLHRRKASPYQGRWHAAGVTERFGPHRLPKPLTLGEVARRSRDGEGKDADKKQKTQRYKPCLSETSYRCAFVFYFAGLALSGAGAPALPKGEPLAKRVRFR